MCQRPLFKRCFVARSLIPQLRIYALAVIAQLDAAALDRSHSSDRAFPSEPRHGVSHAFERFEDRLQIGSREEDASSQFQTLGLQRRGTQRWTGD